MNKKYSFIFLLILNFNFILSEDECSKYFSGYKNIACFSVPLEKEGKECSLINGECIEIESECENYKGSKAEECEGILPKDDPISLKCIFDNGNCKTVSKTCSDYKFGQPEEFCTSIYNNGKHCYFRNGVCSEPVNNNNYNYCEEYEDEDKKICEAITLNNPTKNCKYDTDNGCQSVPIKLKSCQISDTDFCYEIELEDDKKHCFISSDECKEFYKDCSLITDEDECNANIPEDFNRFKCAYKNGKCDYEPINKCETFLRDEYCNEIKLPNKNKTCRYLAEGCIETYKQCEFYNGTNQQECESIAPDNYIKIKCVFSEGKCKSEKRTSCSDDYALRGYGSYMDICNSIEPNDKDKYCYFKDNMCFEHYKECSLYKGSDETICSQIIPEYDGEDEFISTPRMACEIQNGKCVNKTQYKCSDYNTYLHITFPDSIRYYCEDIPISNFLKQCVYKVSDNSCTESEKHCYDLVGNQEICQKAPTLIFWKKCIVEPGTDVCTMEDKQCKEINLDSIKETCEKALASPYRNRCNPFIGPDECVIAEKQCADLSSVIEDTCKVAKTSSSNYKCVVSEDKKSCIEKDINQAYFMNSFLAILLGLMLIF